MNAMIGVTLAFFSCAMVFGKGDDTLLSLNNAKSLAQAPILVQALYAKRSADLRAVSREEMKAIDIIAETGVLANNKKDLCTKGTRSIDEALLKVLRNHQATRDLRPEDHARIMEITDELVQIAYLNSVSVKDTVRRYLNLSKYPSKEVPDLRDFPQLEVLDLNDNKIEVLPDGWVRNLQHLRTLHLVGNELTALPDSIGTLINLRILDVKGNKLQRLPDLINNLTQLKKLCLNNNALRGLPGLEKLQHLKSLSVAQNRLETLPDSLGDLEQLERLHLGGNDLIELPASITKLSKLTFLSLINNDRLGTVPEFEHCTRLKIEFPVGHQRCRSRKKSDLDTLAQLKECAVVDQQGDGASASDEASPSCSHVNDDDQEAWVFVDGVTA